MSIFKRNNSKRSEIKIKDKRVANLIEAIPSDIKKLLYFSAGTPQSFDIGSMFVFSIDFDTQEIIFPQLDNHDDPSTIYTVQPVSSEINLEISQKLDYYPSYSNLSPEQKKIYLTWLSDIRKPIDIGFVFLFYYGLERQLLLGHFDDAFQIILRLREHHKNDSFLDYSSRSLLYACVFRDRQDKMNELQFLLEEEVWDNEQLLICYYLKQPIGPEKLTSLFNGITQFNRRYIKKNRTDYESALKSVFEKHYSEEFILLENLYPLNKVAHSHKIIFANYSFPENVRNPRIRDYTQDTDFLNMLESIHEEAHDLTKKMLKDKRKKK